MEIEMVSISYRLLLLGGGVITGILMRPFILRCFGGLITWVSTLFERVTPGRTFGALSKEMKTLSEQAQRTNEDIDDIKKILIRMIDSEKRKVATPLANGIATRE